MTPIDRLENIAELTHHPNLPRQGAEWPFGSTLSLFGLARLPLAWVIYYNALQ